MRTESLFETMAASGMVSPAAVVTLPALGGWAYVLHHIQWSYSGTPTDGLLTVQDGAAGPILWQQAITAGGPGGQAPDELGTVGNAMVITLSAGGSGITGRIAGVRALLTQVGS